MDWFEKLAVVFAFILVFGVGLKTGFDWGVRREQTTAIEADAGRWTIDAKTGVKRFEYGKGGGS